MASTLNIRNLFIKEIETTPIDILQSLYEYLIFLKQRKFKKTSSPKIISEEQENYSSLSVEKFTEIWDNDEDAVYDKFV